MGHVHNLVRNIPGQGPDTDMKMSGGEAELEIREAMQALLPRTPKGTTRTSTSLLSEGEEMKGFEESSGLA